MKSILTSKSFTKTMVLVVVTVASAISCEKWPGGSGNAVGFKVICDETKGVPTTSSNIVVDGNTFLVDLIDMTEGSDEFHNVVTSNELVTYQPASGDDDAAWAMQDMIYWENRTLDAWSRYPASLDGGSMSVPSALSEDGAEIITYDGDNKAQIVADRTALRFNYLTCTASGTCADNQDDLLFAYSGGCNAKDNDGKIKVNFYHALSAVYFKFGEAKTGQTIETSTDAEKVILTSLTVSGVKRAGTCTFTPGNYVNSDPSTMFSWDTDPVTGLDRSVGSYVQNYDQEVKAGDFVGGGTSFETTKSFFVIPQAMTSDAALTVNWTKDGQTRLARTVSIATTTDKNGDPYEVVWKAGYKYLYTIRLVNNGTDVALDLTVLPWNKTSQSIDYEDEVGLNEGGELAFSQCTPNADNTRFAVKNGLPVIVNFNLKAPEGGTWLVGLDDYSCFSVSPSSGAVGDPATVQIIPDPDADRTVEHTVKLKISVRRADGRTISADSALNTSAYTIVLPAA